MKKFLIIAMVLISCGLNVQAQTKRYEMRLWQGNKYISYPVESVDSVTFVLQKNDEEENNTEYTETIDLGPMTSTSRIRYDFTDLYEPNCENVILNNTETQLRFAAGLNKKEYYKGNCVWLEGNCDATFLLPSVPTTDTYEIRIGYTASEENSICQIYFGSDPNNLIPAGIPFDLRVSGNSQQTGWAADTYDLELNDEVDKRMHNNGFMKAPAVPLENVNQSQGEATVYVLRPNPNCLRHIVVKQQLEANKKYYLKLRSVFGSNRPIPLDYIEFCPQSVFNNQEIPEDKY